VLRERLSAARRSGTLAVVFHGLGGVVAGFAGGFYANPGQTNIFWLLVAVAVALFVGPHAAQWIARQSSATAKED
jgi:membrane protein DedA with SNARE-associated domain